MYENGICISYDFVAVWYTTVFAIEMIRFHCPIRQFWWPRLSLFWGNGWNSNSIYQRFQCVRNRDFQVFTNTEWGQCSHQNKWYKVERQFRLRYPSRSEFTLLRRASIHEKNLCISDSNDYTTRDRVWLCSISTLRALT